MKLTFINNYFDCSGSSESSCNPASSTHLSKEEVGEILVHEMERRRLRAVPTPSVRSLPKDSTADDKARIKYEDMLRRQLKTFAAKEKGHCINGVGCYDNQEKLRNSGDMDVDTSGYARRFPSSNSHSTETGLRVKQEECSARTDSIDAIHLPHSISDNSIQLSDKPTMRLQCPPKSCSSPAAKVIPTRADVHRRSVPNIFMSGNANHVTNHVTGIKMKKTVTFSDNVKLLCCDADEIIPMARGDHLSQRPTNSVGILKNYLPTYVCSDTDPSNSASGDSLRTAASELDPERESDGTSADDSDAELDEVSPDGRTRCGLCRRKWADLGVTYCLDCGAYMSKLQPVR